LHAGNAYHFNTPAGPRTILIEGFNVCRLNDAGQRERQTVVMMPHRILAAVFTLLTVDPYRLKTSGDGFARIEARIDADGWFLWVATKAKPMKTFRETRLVEWFTAGLKDKVEMGMLTDYIGERV